MPYFFPFVFIGLCHKSSDLCEDGWTFFGNHCYLFLVAKKDWDDSRDECTKAGAHLVKIDNKAENDFIYNHRVGTMWIGLHKANNEFEWIDGTTPRYFPP